MSKCIQKFKGVIPFILKNGGRDALLSLKNPQLDIQTVGTDIETLASNILEFNKQNEAVLTYSFNSLEKELVSAKVNDIVIPQVLALVKAKLSDQVEELNTNPLVIVNDQKVPLFDFSNLPKLFHGIASLESTLEYELMQGLYSVSFLNLNTNKDFEYSNFVVTNAALAQNVKIYKNELWNHIITSLGLKPQEELKFIYKKTSLGNGEYAYLLNDALFIPNSEGMTYYNNVLINLKEFFDNNPTSLTRSNLFIKGAILSNFDSFVSEKFSDLIGVEEENFGTYLDPIQNETTKYRLHYKGIASKGWSDGTISETDISNHTSSITKMISNIIPIYNKESGEKFGNMTMGTNALNAVGATLNSLPNNFKLEIDGVSRSLSEWFNKYDKGEITFQEILLALNIQGKNHESLFLLSDYIHSLYKFLYDPTKGVSRLFETWKGENKQYLDAAIDVEKVLINQIRNTSKVIYRTEEIGKKGKSLDLLHMDSKIGGDLTAIFANLSKFWDSDPNWNPTNFSSYTNLFKFLEEYADAFIPELVRKEVIKKAGGKDFISTANQKILKDFLFKQSTTISHDEHGSEISTKDTPETIAQKYRTLDSKDVNLKEILKLKYKFERFNVVTNTKSFEGNSWPTMAISNIGFLFNSLVSKDEDNKYIFSQYPNLVNGMEVLAEVINKESAKSVDKLNHKEAFKLAFIRNFVMSGVNEDKIFVQPFNFSDKTKILALSINSNEQINGTPLSKLSIDNIKKELYQRQNKYYGTLVQKIYDDFNKIAKFKTKATSLEKQIQQIEEFLSTNNKKFLKHNNENVQLIEELHYSVYKDGIKFNELIKANALIFSSEEKFKQWVDSQENKLKKYLELEGLNSVSSEELAIFNGEVPIKEVSKINDIISEKFNLNEKPLNILEKQSNLHLINEDGTLSELVQKYLWTKDLFITQYENMSVKGSYLHPSKMNYKPIEFDKKGEWVNTWATEENKRTVAFTKRMVIIGASMSIFNKGYSGLLPSYKIAIFEDPKALTFNLSGQTHSQDTYDGAIPVNAFFYKQTISALPGMNLGRVQKPIGTSIDDFNSTFLKCATFGISNELVRSSMNSEFNLDDWMERMNSVDLFENLDDSRNIFMLPSINSNNIDPISIPDGLYVPLNGDFKELLKITWEGGNKYTQHFDNGITKKININNLYDAWNALGGAFSARILDGKLTFNEESIDFIASLIQKQSLNNEKLDQEKRKINKLILDTSNNKSLNSLEKAESIKLLTEQLNNLPKSLELRDKMIAMFAMKSAVKNGAGNINTRDILVKGNKEKIQTIDFKTDFFGIQLDAGHEADESNVSEITQVISAISENNFTPEIFNDLYQSISNIVETALEDFHKLKQSGQIEKLTELFVDELSRSAQTSNNKAIIDAIYEKGITLIPFSNPTIYAQFISSIISKINTDYIRRKFSGAAMVLHPSQGMFKIFENNTGKTYFYEDLLQKIKYTVLSPEDQIILDTIKNSDSPESVKINTTVEFILKTLPEFAPIDININEVNPFDTISLENNITLNGKEYESGNKITLSNIKDYYAIKKQLAGSQNLIKKYYNVSRDLKPADIKTVDITGKKENIFDLDGINLRYIVEDLIEKIDRKKLPIGISVEAAIEDLIVTNPAIDQFVKYLNINNKDFNIIFSNYKADPKTYGNYYLSIIGKYLQRFAQRSMDVISVNKRFKTTAEVGFETNPFDTILSYFDNGIIKKDNLKYGFSKEYDYTGTHLLSQVIHKDAEKIIPKKFRSEFLLGDTNHADINQDFFIRKIKNKMIPPSNTRYDIYLASYKTDSKLSIVIKSEELSIENGNLISKGKILAKKRFLPTIETIEVDKSGKETVVTYRKGHNGKKMYPISKDTQLFTDDKGTEILLVNSIDEAVNIVDSTKNQFNFIQINDFFQRGLNKNINISDIATRNNPEIETVDDSTIKLYDATIKIIGDFQNRKYLEKKKLNYISTRAKEILEPGSNFKDLLKNPELDKEYAIYVASGIFKSWQMSNKSLDARIPAQAYQSFMSMSTVGYTQENVNNAYVSHWQLWLQGSDFDIDKAYMMMYEFKNGMFQGWSPMFNQNNMELSLELPLPNKNKKYTGTSIKKSVAFDLTKIFENKDHISFKLENKVKLLNILKNEDIVELYHPNEKFLNKVIKELNKHNSYKNESAVRNFIVYNLIKASTAPRNQIPSYTPISFGDYTEIGNRASSGAFPISNHDGFTTFMQQEQNAIGKDVIGVAATGLKVYFSLVTYFSNYYNGKIKPEDNQFFLRHFKLGDKEIIASKIGGLNLKEASEITLKDSVKKLLNDKSLYQKKDGTFYNNDEIDALTNVLFDEDPGLKISALLSLATDNAKELILAKINAGLDFAGMHIYMLILGIDEETSASFMTSPEAMEIKRRMTSDFFTQGHSSGRALVNAAIKSYLSELAQEPKTIQEKIDLLAKEDGTKNAEEILKLTQLKEGLIVKNAKSIQTVNEFERIFIYAGELTSLGSFESVNQGSKAKVEDIYSLTSKFSNVLESQTKTFFGNVITESKKASDSQEVLIAKLIDSIKKDKPYLSLNYITKTFEKALSYNLMDGMDSLRYYNDLNYRKAVLDYYNLIKYTFNIFDVVSSIPHYNSMLKAFHESENVITNNVKKYKFLRTTIPTLLEVAKVSEELDSKNINSLTRNSSNPEYSIFINKKLIPNINGTYDKLMIKKWIDSLDLKLDILALASYLKKDELTVLVNDKTSVITDTINNFEGSYGIADLSTEFGKAQFKHLMEYFIIPQIKETFKGNKFLDHYVFKSQKVFNMSKQIKFYKDIANAGLLAEIEHDMVLLNNNTDNKYNLPIKAVLNEETNKIDSLDNIKVLDLLYLYDLITNQGRYGGNRATTFFSSDLKNKNSYSRKFVDFQLATENNDNFLNEISDKIKSDSEFRHVLYFELFGKSNRIGKSVIIKDPKKDLDGELSGAISLSVNNPNYIFLDSIEEIKTETSYQRDKTLKIAKKIAELLKSGAIIVNQNCK